MDLESKRLKLKEITWDDGENIHMLQSFAEVDEYNTPGIPQKLLAPFRFAHVYSVCTCLPAGRFAKLGV
jgi:hypothetical protein